MIQQLTCICAFVQLWWCISVVERLKNFSKQRCSKSPLLVLKAWLCLVTVTRDFRNHDQIFRYGSEIMQKTAVARCTAVTGSGNVPLTGVLAEAIMRASSQKRH
jgi:hypothetical protein